MRMHVDLIELLRGPNPHADGWLVARADVVIDRRMVQGAIGCPICGAEWPVVDGALTFTAGVAIEAPAQPTAVTTRRAAEEEALRTAALLDLREAASVVALTGELAQGADALVALTGVRVLAVNPPAGVAMAHSRLFVHQALPLGVATLRGARLDGAHAHPHWIDSVSRALQRGGRLIAPVSCAVPESLREIARDGQEWVADVQVAASGLVPLRRG
jgi:hypothetical protein